MGTERILIPPHHFPASRSPEPVVARPLPFEDFHIARPIPPAAPPREIRPLVPTPTTTPGALAGVIRTLPERVPLLAQVAAPVPVVPPVYQPSSAITFKTLGFEVAKGAYFPKGLSPLFVTYLAPQPIGFMPPKYYGLKEDFLFGITAHRATQLFTAPEYLEAKMSQERFEKANPRNWSVEVIRGNPTNSSTEELHRAQSYLRSQRNLNAFERRDLEVINGELAFRREIERALQFGRDPFQVPNYGSRTLTSLPPLLDAEIARTLSREFGRQGNIRVVQQTLTAVTSIVFGTVANSPVLSLTTSDDVPSPNAIIEAAHALARGPVRNLAGERGDP